jgi:hypothetical protein
MSNGKIRMGLENCLLKAKGGGLADKAKVTTEEKEKEGARGSLLLRSVVGFG